MKLPIVPDFPSAKQTDSTFDEPIVLGSDSLPDEVDFIHNDYVFGILHKNDSLGNDVDYYTYTLTGNGNPAIYNAPIFGYPLVPACEGLLDRELHVLIVGPSF